MINIKRKCVPGTAVVLFFSFLLCPLLLMETPIMVDEVAWEWEQGALVAPAGG